MTNFTPSAANLLATETPCLGSEASSPYSTVIFWPRMPPAALMSAMAWSTPFRICAPVAALGPVIGPPMPNFTCAVAEPAAATAMPSARPRVLILFICFPLRSVIHASRRCRRDPTLRRLTPPAHPTLGFIEPAILSHHLGGAGGAESKQCRRQADEAIHQIIMRRQQRAAEQAEMDEA